MDEQQQAYVRALYDLRQVAEAVAESMCQPGESTLAAAQRLEAVYPIPAALVVSIGSDLSIMLLRHTAYIQGLERGEQRATVSAPAMPAYGPSRRQRRAS